MTNIALKNLLTEVRACQICADHLPLGPRPVVRAQTSARVLIVGQAPGTKVHATGIPWNDPSGDRLREWMGLDREAFYDASNIAIVPMGFCYPGKGSSGDLPPRKECAEQWHQKILAQLPNVQLTLLIGRYAQQYYLPGEYKTVTDCVKDWHNCLPRYLPLVHPSPRNRRWLRNNPWFEAELVPVLREKIQEIL